MLYFKKEYICVHGKILQLHKEMGKSVPRLTCGFDLARFSIFIQASSRSFDLAFSLLNKTKLCLFSFSTHLTSCEAF